MDTELRVLTKEEIEENLMHLPGWKFESDKISKEFEFESFIDGINLVNELSPFLNQIDHHPDIHIYVKKIRFDLHRFDIGGKVTNLDFIVAREIEKLYGEYRRNLD